VVTLNPTVVLAFAMSDAPRCWDFVGMRFS
jgi:hypothetical protein